MTLPCWTWICEERFTHHGRLWRGHSGFQAAAYLFYLCRNHPFVDGNKRTALATCLVFLGENGLLPHERLDTDAWEALTIDVAASQIDREQTTERLRALIGRSGKK